MEQQELSYIAGGDAKQSLEDKLAVSYKTKHTLTICFSESALWYLLKGVENLCPYRNLHTDVYGGLIHNCQTLKATKCPPVGEWINKLWHIQTVEYLFITKKKWAIKPWEDMKETWKLSERSQSEKATACMILTVWHSGRGKTMETIRIVVARG